MSRPMAKIFCYKFSRKHVDVKGRRPQKKMQPKTIKSKNNGCGTASGNLVSYILTI